MAVLDIELLLSQRLSGVTTQDRSRAGRKKRQKTQIRHSIRRLALSYMVSIPQLGTDVAAYPDHMVEDLRRGAERMGERASAARDAMGERASAAKEAVGERASAAKEATADAIAAVKPKLRGVSHEWAFFVSLGLGAGLIVAAKTPKATLAVAIYAVSLSALLGTSALYHRVNWKRPNVRRWMRRLDHSMIFFLIAGTYTPFALLVLNGPLADAILVVVWIGAIAGAIVEMIWIDHPKWVAALIYLSLGWVAVARLPRALERDGRRRHPAGRRRRPPLHGGRRRLRDPAPQPQPGVFGYHEVFHAARHRRRRGPLRGDRLLRPAARLTDERRVVHP